MIGKKNIVFGFLYLVFTAALGPYMVNMYEGYMAANADKQQALARLQQLKAADYAEDPETLEEVTAMDLAKADAEAILALNRLGNEEFAIDFIKGGPHAHGNLESVLNILAGLALTFMAAPRLAKQLVSWLFILGALLHSGGLYLQRVFMLPVPDAVTGLGAVLVLLALLLLGLTAWKHLGPEVVRD